MSYLTPVDDDEWRRLDKQHSVLTLALNGLYPCPDIVEAVLAPTDGEPKRILDLGSGTGVWAMEMAHRFPHAAVKGIDLAPTPLDVANFPPNLQMEISDINDGLTHCFQSYDLVHMRFVLSGITNFENTLRDLQLCLKPGGVLLIVGGDVELEDAFDHKVPLKRLEGDEDVSSVSDNGSWLQRILWEGTQACSMAGSDRMRGIELMERGLWEQPLLDPETAISGGVYIPIGPWGRSSDPTEDQVLRYAGILMQQSFLNLHRAYHPMLLKQGMDQATLTYWSQQADIQLKTMQPNLWARCRWSLARKRTGENLPAPPLPTPDPPIESGSAEPSSSPMGYTYHAHATYHSLNEAVSASQKRRDSRGVWPQPAVRRAWIARQQRQNEASADS